MAAADVNGDGLPDLISANAGDDPVTVLTNAGSGGFALCALLQDTDGPFCVAAADVNCNGNVDLICANQDGAVTVLTNSRQMALSLPAFSASTGFKATLSGNAGNVYAIETSTDLIQWAPWHYVLMTNATLRFTNVSSVPSLFFRAVRVTAPALLSPAYSRHAGFQASLSGTPGLTYVIEISTDLVNWTPLQTNVNTNSLWFFTDPTTISPADSTAP